MSRPYETEHNASEKDVGVGGQEPDVNEVTTKGLDQSKLKQYDTAAAFLQDLSLRSDAAELMAPWTEAEEKAVKRKLDKIVLPLVTMSLLLGGVDKVILGTSATFGLRDDLGLVGQDYSWASSLIFFGCITSVGPQTWLCQRLPTGKVFACNVFMFGVMTFATMGVRNAGELWAVRYILGLFEGLNTSGAGMVIGMWYKKSEQGWRTVLIFNTFSSVVNGLLSMLSIACGVLDWIFFPANASTAWWLSDRERFIAVSRMATNQTGIVNTHFKWSHAKEAVLDIRTWLLNIPNGGLNGFYSIVIQGFNFDVKRLTLMNIPTGVISWVASIIWVTIAKYTKQPLLCAMGSILVCLSGTITLTRIPPTNVGGSLAALYIMFMYWAPYMVFGQLIMYANVGGTSKKVVVYTISYLGYAVGNLIGPQSFRANEAPGYSTAYTVMLSGYCISIGLLTLYGFLCWRDNKRKDAQEQQWLASLGGNEPEVAAEWQDMTDKQNPKFRYTF